MNLIYKKNLNISKSQRDSLTKFSRPATANDFNGKDMGPWYSAEGLFF